MFTFSEVKNFLSIVDRVEVENFLSTVDTDFATSNAADIAAKLLEITEDGKQAAYLLNGIEGGGFDINTENWRLINAENIDSILANELSFDPYILGCFSAWAIADATDWPVALIEAAQKGEVFSEIGEAMTTEQIEKLAKIYAAEDGYGHYFASYDGATHEIITRDSAGAAADLFYLFRIN